MSLLRGDVYVWSDGQHWFLWSDHADHAETAVWAEGREPPRGVAIPVETFDYIAREYVRRYPTPQVADVFYDCDEGCTREVS